jgi:hypothetical protein
MKILNLLFCWPHCSFPVVRALDWQLAVRFHKKINAKLANRCIVNPFRRALMSRLNRELI